MWLYKIKVSLPALNYILIEYLSGEDNLWARSLAVVFLKNSNCVRSISAHLVIKAEANYSSFIEDAIWRD